MPQLKILPATRLCSNKGSAKTLRWYFRIYYLGNLNNNAGSIGDAVPAHLHGCSWSLLRKKLVPRFKLDITSFSITPNIITKSSSSRFKGQRWNGSKFWEVPSFVSAFKIQFLNRFTDLSQETNNIDSHISLGKKPFITHQIGDQFYQEQTKTGWIQRKTWCMGFYAGVDNDLTLCRRQSRLKQFFYARVDLSHMLESTLSPSQRLRIWHQRPNPKKNMVYGTLCRTVV